MTRRATLPAVLLALLLAGCSAAETPDDTPATSAGDALTTETSPEPVDEGKAGSEESALSGEQISALVSALAEVDPALAAAATVEIDTYVAQAEELCTQLGEGLEADQLGEAAATAFSSEAVEVTPEQGAEIAAAVEETVCA